MLSNAGNFFRLWIKLLLVISSMQDFTTCILTAVLIDSDFGKILLNTHAAVFVRQKGLIDLYGRIQNPGSKYCFPDTCCWCHRDTWRCPLVSVPSCTSCRERERPLLKSEKVRIGSWKGGDGISHVCHQRNWFASCFALSLSFVIIHSLHLSPNPQQKKAKNKNKKQAYLYPECLRCLPSVQFLSFTDIRMNEFEKKPDRELMTLWWTGFPASLPVCCISVYENIRGAQQQSPGLESLLCLVCMFLCRISSLLPHTCMSGQWWL